jgi:hypothetical protein
MDGSASSILMFGLGNGTFDGSPSLMVTRGLGIAAQAATMTGPWINVMELHAGKRLELHAGQRLELRAGNKLELQNG